MAVLTVSISLPDCGPHQDRAINLIMEEFYKLIEYGTGCIQGDALISINRAGKGWTLPLAQLVRMQNGERAIGPHGTILGPKWDLTIPTRIQREKDGVVQLATLSGAWCSGPKETFTVRTNTGREIRATAEHPFLTERGWLRLEDLEIGDLLHVRGKQASTGRGSKPRYIYEYRVQAHPYSVRHRRKDRPTDSYTVDQHRLVAEARENGIPYPKYLERIREGNVAGLKFLDPQKWEIHHRDRNSKNNSPDNLLVCYADGHPRTHAYEGTYKNVLFKINTETVILIEPYGEEITYDLEVDGEPHNFLANGIVVHNTGKTRIFVEAIEALVAAGEIPVLVMVPNSLIEQTVEEFEKWTSQSWVAHHVMALDGALTLENRAQLLKFGKCNVYIISHESMSYPIVRSALGSRRWAAAFLDEASRFRNYSKRTVTLQTVGRTAKSRYAFTGNLAPKNPADVWYVANWLQPGVFGTTNRQTFIADYCLLGGWEGRQPIGIRPDRHKKFISIMDSLRITCELRDLRTLPDRPLHTHRVTIAPKAKSVYTQMQETLRVEIERENDEAFHSHVRTYATRLQRLQEIGAGFARNIAGDVEYLPCTKTNTLIDLLEDEPTIPTVVWGWWVPELQKIEQALKKARLSYVTFGHPGAVQSFMEGRVNIFISQIARGGYGLNLTRAERMIYHSLPWDLDAYLQSQERNMRLTTTAKRLEIVHLVTRNSVDEYVRKRLVEKADLSAKLTRSQALEMLQGAP